MDFLGFIRKKHESLFSRYQERNFLYLLISLVLLFFLWPLLMKIRIGQYLFTLLMLIALFSGPHTIKQELFFFIAAPLFIIIIAFLEILSSFNIDASAIVLDTYIMLGVLSSVFIVVITLRYVLARNNDITVNKVYGAVCAYILIGISYGLIYFLIARVNSDAIFPPFDYTDPIKEVSRYVYYSFVSLTSTGFGDIYPKSSVARQFTISEMVIGQIYTVVLIGWLVENLHSFRK